MVILGWILTILAGVPVIAGGAQTISEASSAGGTSGFGWALLGAGVWMVGRGVAAVAEADQKRPPTRRGPGLFGPADQV